MQIIAIAISLILMNALLLQVHETKSWKWSIAYGISIILVANTIIWV